MNFTTGSGNAIEIDPLSQRSIDAAKAVAPGQGVGPAVAGELLQRIAEGAVTSTTQLPLEYQHLGKVAGFAD